MVDLQRDLDDILPENKIVVEGGDVTNLMSLQTGDGSKRLNRFSKVSNSVFDANEAIVSMMRAAGMKSDKYNDVISKLCFAGRRCSH